MSLLIHFDSTQKSTYAVDQSTKDILTGSFFGTVEGRKLVMLPEEALYLMDVRNARCTTPDGETELSFNDVASKFSTGKKFMARYFTYKDWRDRGLIIKGPEKYEPVAGKANMQIKKYHAQQLRVKARAIKGVFFIEDMITVVDDEEKGRSIYNEHWFGQHGTYKVKEHGRLNKLDIYETLFLINLGILGVSNFTKREIIKIAEKRRSDFQKLYSVYADWRSKGYVIKTGFKFGTHFRVYFPGAQPVKTDSSWIHSMHVIHVFPRDTKLLISEWARVIRVAHSVRKTFILAIPGKSRRKTLAIDFALYHRRGNEIETPEKTKPRFGMLSLSEEEYIGGAELSAIINEAKSNRQELIIAIADRESSVTYYRVKRIELQGSDYEYYEIDWMQP
ncbi:MAG: tRNA-intron lyase [Candidatus Micrarchaeota archaeon]|nr:tRNA-intron lyase [Candidatus Micrarchaeota archaeon]